MKFTQRYTYVYIQIETFTLICEQCVSIERCKYLLFICKYVDAQNNKSMSGTPTRLIYMTRPDIRVLLTLLVVTFETIESVVMVVMLLLSTGVACIG